MSSEQIGGIIRAVVPAALAYLVARGWLTQSMVADIAAALVTLASAAWSIYTNSTSAIKKTALSFKLEGK